jgi:hypothetical protein
MECLSCGRDTTPDAAYHEYLVGLCHRCNPRELMNEDDWAMAQLMKRIEVEKKRARNEIHTLPK